MNHKENQKEKNKIKSKYKNNNTKNIKGKEGVLPEKNKNKNSVRGLGGKKSNIRTEKEARAREAAARGEIATKEN